MRVAGIVVFSIVFWVLSAQAQDVDAKGGQPLVSATATQDFRFTSWSGTRGSNIFAPQPGKGSQIYVPSLAGLVVEWPEAKWEVAAKTGYVWSSHRTPGQEASYNGPVDSQASLLVTLGTSYLRPVLGVAVNIPTGESVLSGQRRLTRMDPDLVELGTYGEGFNITPSLGVTFAPTANFIVTPSIGYSWRGEFDRESFVPATGLFTGRHTIDPGDVLTASVSAIAKVGTWIIQGSAGYTAESEVYRDGVAIGKKGDGAIANVAALYPVSDKVNVLLNGSWGYFGKNDVPGSNGLVTELRNSNSHVFIGAIQPTYDLTDRLRIGFNYSFLYRNNNYYDTFQELYVPARVKHSVGPVLDYVIAPNATLSLAASRFWVVQDTGPNLVTQEIGVGLNTVINRANLPPELHFSGWSVSASAKVQF